MAQADVAVVEDMEVVWEGMMKLKKPSEGFRVG